VPNAIGASTVDGSCNKDDNSFGRMSGSVASLNESTPTLQEHLLQQLSLTALTDSTYTMAVSYTQPFSHPGNTGVIEATIGGSGTIQPSAWPA
jgi:hypothetical protein